MTQIKYSLFALLVFCNVLDIVFTHSALSNGLYEANPVSRSFIEYSGIAGLAIYKGLILSVLLILLPYAKSVYVVSFFVFSVGVYSGLTGVHIYYYGGIL